MHDEPFPELALIGFGEAASTFAAAACWGARAIAYDVLPSRRAAIGAAGLRGAADSAEALTHASIVLSLVTADAALDAAQNGARWIERGTVWCDMNSVAPDTKRAAEKAIAAAGGCYVDVAVLAPVNLARMAVPLLLSGPDAQRTQDMLGALGFTQIRTIGREVGRASAIKMIRSVMVKGIEALTDEMMQAAEAAGVAGEVLASLDASEKAQSWTERAAYNRERMATHGARRAAEMAESAATLRALGVDPVMTEGTVQRQRAAARHANTRDAA